MNFKNIFSILFFISLFFTISAFQLPKKTTKKVAKEIKNVFNTTDYILDSVSIPSSFEGKLKSSLNNSNFFSIKLNDTLIGFAYVDSAPSKTADFDYLILLDPKLVILKTKVLMYREEYGGEIASTRWLKQFIGKTFTNSYEYPKDISAISGATISVRSMTYSVDCFMNSIRVLHENNIL